LISYILTVLESFRQNGELLEPFQSFSDFMHESTMLRHGEGVARKKLLRQAPETGHGEKQPIDTTGHEKTDIADIVQPMPEHSLVFGHLLAVKKAMDAIPDGAHPTLAFGEISRKFPAGLFYLDLWPISVPFMIVTSATMANQATQQSNLALERPAEVRDWFRPIAGGPALFDMSHDEWKRWRSLCNPGFSAANLLTHVSEIVEETLVYRASLDEHARKGDIFQLNNVTLRFTLDLMGRVVL
jgi:hypothetical protein